MEHNGSQAQDETGYNVAELLASLGINDDIAVDTPPDWVTQPLTGAQRLAFSQLVLHSASAGLQRPETQAMLLVRLGMQPGLPPQGGGFLVFAGAELMAAVLLDNERHRRGARDIASVLGLISKAEHEIAQCAEPVADEDQDQDAGNPAGVGA